jgi:hypothetical protein
MPFDKVGWLVSNFGVKNLLGEDRIFPTSLQKNLEFIISD